MKRYALATLLLLSLHAAAAEWIRIRPLSDADQFFYDRSKLYISGDEITYWKKVAFKIPVTVKGQAAVSGLYRERIHCAEHTLKLISYLLYTSDGGTIEYISSNEGEAAPIIPDTVGDIFEKTVCELVRQKQEFARQKKIEETLKAGSEKESPRPAILPQENEPKPLADKLQSQDAVEKEPPLEGVKAPVVN